MLPVDCAGDSDHTDVPANDVQDLMRDSLEKVCVCVLYFSSVTD